MKSQIAILLLVLILGQANIIERSLNKVYSK